MNARCVLQEDSSENDKVFKSIVPVLLQLQKCTLFHKLSMLFPYIPSCEAHKQFGAEPAQYGLEINCKFLFFYRHELLMSFFLMCSKECYLGAFVEFQTRSKLFQCFQAFSDVQAQNSSIKKGIDFI